uniref:Large ribosomal subunit protein bL19c n=1 Tax=Ectocarpus siliculosus TaxID=2880 RepID=D1J767_ECTSI|nr:50S ribosomal protein L19 [Ectocarpus siliculosus]CAT18789.1 Chloroplast 50S ribosomal protein L19 [Ectocarpus siliculosus]CAV31251.1 Chloroplast 50S ribosomal protein L19 [Ectocarpus siliculosus]
MNYKRISIVKTFMNNRFIESVEKVYIKKNLKKLFVGDTVKIGVFVEEGNKERVQFYEGIILAKSKSCINFTISVRKVFQGIGIERAFLVNSPKLASIEILKSARVRKSKLYYLRNIIGKAGRLKQRVKKK